MSGIYAGLISSGAFLMAFLFHFCCRLLANQQVIEQGLQASRMIGDNEISRPQGPKSLIKMFAPLRKTIWFEYGLALVAFAAVSLANLWLQNWIGYEAIALVYLLAVVLLALFVGRGPILFGTALTALGWSVVFAPPQYSFHIGSFYDKMMFAMYFIVALTVAQLTARLKAERLAEKKREERARALYLFTRELAGAADRTDILERVVTQVGQVFNADVALLLGASQSDASFQAFPKGTWVLNDSELVLASSTWNRKQPLDHNVLVPLESTAIYLPMSAGGAPEGVLAVRSKSDARFSSDQRDLLENFARQTALVLDRQRLREAEVKTKLLAESERFGRTLLNSVSHELRTPLSAISTATASLRDAGTLSPIQQKLAGEIDSATARLNRVVQSLLSAARIQSGQVRPNVDWCDISDVVRAALREAGALLANHQVVRQIEPGLPLIRADFILLQQALINLLVNAALYTASGTQVTVTARREDAELLLQINDRGPGLPSDEIGRIFDLFHRNPGAKPGGTGLGLAIVKGFVEAQGGQVQAENRADGGASFSIRLPVREIPAFAEEPA
jgi:two-component system sensor histidine kinase KdpD